jgi:hypothetical protein
MNTLKKTNFNGWYETTFGSITLTSTLAVITAAGIFYAPSLIWNTITMVPFI